MAVSSATLGSSCATLQDGIKFMEECGQEEALMKELQDPLVHKIFQCPINLLKFDAYHLSVPGLGL